MDNFHHLLYPQPGWTRQVSSFGRDPERGSRWGGYRHMEALIKRILIAPGETHTMAVLSGPGMITRMTMTTLLPFNVHALRNLVLRFYWDGETHPSVESPFGDFFGAPFGTYQPYASAPLSLTAGAFNCLWLMPYESGARLDITNEGSKVVDPFFYNITYQELPEEAPSPLRFHAHWQRQNPTRPGLPFTILDAEGSGHYVGCHLNMQNREWWLRPPLRAISFPRGFGLGMMEGWETITRDGERVASIKGTGTEDYFNGSWYYLPKAGRFSAPYHGCIVRDLLRSRIAIYRFDMSAPVSFAHSVRVDIDHGFYNELSCDYASTAYWYQTEPHRSFAGLPPVDLRQPEPATVNLAQSALLLAPPVSALLALLWSLRRRTKS
ncbi:MAG TPA: glycoside hydrolase family 172 protein [Anaerolineales bacterium]|nr:glycoside hydrolase family 172 protein [Anaerolineales bacterium]